ncbi:glyoxylase I 4 [Vitis vinifera]|uniref:VOC domain-containing protein n=2 Tax=Vitis vinifera TaxID=29760 RepID=F6GWP8_VITVI|nr:glyoxylase I 4 [Vitis vinifera]|eukprot:XP_003631871.2 PREDICTED: lactoylglutathione lyase [Vitis vinifera]
MKHPAQRAKAENESRVTRAMEIEELNGLESLPLLSLNHVSLLCRSVWNSVRFYEDVLGFCLIKRPTSFDFTGAWLFNYGIGIHLLENPAMEEYDQINDPRPINPKDNHISFLCTDVGIVKKRLQEMGMRYVTAVVEDDDANKVDQVFFHDPDGYMIEICNCENIPIIPISSCSLKPRESLYNSTTAGYKCGFVETVMMDKCGFMETVMMESLSKDMMNFSF